MQFKFTATAFFMFILPSFCIADEQQAPTVQVDLFSLVEGESKSSLISDKELLLIRGLGDDGAPIIIPGSLSVILWDEMGNGNTNTRHDKSTGSNNSQNVNLILIDANGTR